MRSPEEIEAGLQRLMPRGLSLAAQESIEDAIDELAQDDRDIPHPHRRSWGLAAVAIAMLGMTGIWWNGQRQGAMPALAAIEKTSSGTAEDGSWLREREKLEGTHANEELVELDGTAHQAIRYDVVEERDWRDRRTGLVVKVREPREELVLVPVSSF